jgi:hypothetical protein
MPDGPNLNHQNHTAISFTRTGDELRAAVSVGSTDATVKSGNFLDDLHFHFLADATLKVVCRVSQNIAVNDPTVDGVGAVAFAKNGVPITLLTAFAPSDVLSVTADEGMSVTLQRYLV